MSDGSKLLSCFNNYCAYQKGYKCMYDGKRRVSIDSEGKCDMFNHQSREFY